MDDCEKDAPKRRPGYGQTGMGKKGTATRTAILDAVQAMLAEGVPWHSLTVREVARHIDKAPATVYSYFATLDEVLLELYDRETEAGLDALLRQPHLGAVAALVLWERANLPLFTDSVSG